MPTPHIEAAAGDFAPTVLMPGDPRRAKRIAETFFDAPRLVTEVRGILGYTGTYEGMPVSVLASGMGMPSMTIYATELVREYGARTLIRVGTAGALQPDIGLGGIIAASAAHTDSSMSQLRIPGVNFSHSPSFALLRGAADVADEAGLTLHVGPVFSTDHFYLQRPGLIEALTAHGVLGVDMEAAALYAVASSEGVRALALLTASDSFVTGDVMTPEERETVFENTVRCALGAAQAVAA
ncbi:purine-nucleoside phosphorylase [Subtercola endophyticus]|uniref:purine-nucleoside phosphorylase n=1 Tax=Subtercola endophyticus TaxID=2895559 RepID=UPI001E40266F|nr:purine-nucleoside phosphorylase [Subtercola endophyticus]UFS58351.1 purine-nucleoside phosphorylase [Subtercola endophyticus]